MPLQSLFVVFGHVYTIQTPLFDGEIMMPSWLRHDYGVDMFFVISGFLIGTILIKDYQKNGSISYLKFYSKKISSFNACSSNVIFAIRILFRWKN